MSLFLSKEALAFDEYRISFGDDFWSSRLLEETCPDELKLAVTEVLIDYEESGRELVAILPKKLGYQYFRVEFKEIKNGRLLDSGKPLVYQFQYWTHRDEHTRCVKVEPYNIVN